MATYVSLDTIQRPSNGAVAPSAWGDQVNDNSAAHQAAIVANTAAIAAIPIVKSGSATVTTNSSGQFTIAYPAAFPNSAGLVISSGDAAGGGHIVNFYTGTLTSFTAAVWTLTGTLVVSGGPLNVNWIAVGT